MRLTPPNKTTFYVAVLLAVLGFIFYFVPAVASFAFWLVLVGFIVLAAGNSVKGF